MSLNRDVIDAFAQSRTADQPRADVLALDFGINTLVAISEGDLLGRRFQEERLPGVSGRRAGIGARLLGTT